MAARKFLDLEEAAAMIGVTADQLNELRQRQKISAYRDGGTWKFKPEEIERYMAEQAEEGGASPGGEDENLESILLSERELGGPSGTTSSTVIGKSAAPDGESDIKIAKEGSDLKISRGDSDVRLASESDLLKSGSGLSAKFDDLDPLDLDLTTPTEGGLKGGSSKTKLPPDADLSLDDQDLALGEETIQLMPGSSNKFGGTGGSGIDLAADADDDMVLGGSGLGSDVTLDAGSSGISLVDPKDSGLSLEEEPLALTGSSKRVKALDMGGDDDMILLEEHGDAEAATQLKADDDFLLTPLDDAGVDESDSGSQVIALDSEVEFDESAATMLGGEKLGAVGMLEEDTGADFGEAEFGAAPGLGADLGAAAGGVAVMPVQAVEAPYSMWNVLSLGLCTVLLTLTGMMTYDLMRNMWSWDEPYSVNSSLMETVLGWFK